MTRLTFSDYTARLREFMRCSSLAAPADDSSSQAQESTFNELALALFGLQFGLNLPYRRFCESRDASLGDISHWTEIPAIPASAFKELELTCLAPAERTAVFHSSGTTEQKPSRHFHGIESLAVYEASLLPWFEVHLIGETIRLKCGSQLRMICLTPPRLLAPHSSLVHMFETARRHFGAEGSFFAGEVDASGAWVLDAERIRSPLAKAEKARQSIALMGTAFNFVHLLDHLVESGTRFRLAAGSRVLETGGYKGRSRVLEKFKLHSLITEHLGIPPTCIICEYGMSELSSQAYDSRVQSPNCNFQSRERVFRFPPWARVQIISPETGGEVGEGETGLIRVYDLANVWSVMAIQTEDLGIQRGAGFELVGRANLAEKRGCSLMAL